MQKYKFITFEGVEGCGKSTQVKLLHDFLQGKKEKVVLTREPGGTVAAEEIRNVLVNGKVDKLDGISETLLNFAARRNHVENLIKPALKEDKRVICDRFFDSTLAYQGYGYRIEMDIIVDIKKISISDFKPDITFLIDVDTEVAMKRIKGRDGNNRYENMDEKFHKKVRKGFLEIAKENPKRIKIIDGTKTIEEIHQEIIGILGLS